MEMFGPYRLDEVLGRGGMGEVHRAFDTRRERTVALKRLPAGSAEDTEYRERFRRESRLAARLASPHVVPIHDFGDIDGRLFLDMRLVPGRDLAAALTADGPLAPARAVETVRQIANALDSAHEAGMVHRDVKPSNILMSDHRGGDFAYLLDFGIVRSLTADGESSLTSTGAAIGTLAYMAPEVFAGDGFDHRVDVYALACVLFEALTGRRPFDADGAGLMYRHLNVPPPRLADVRPDLPAALGDVVARGMAKNPADRPPTAGDLADLAVRALVDAPPTVPAPGVTTPAPPAGTPAPRPRRRRRGLIAAAIVALLVLGGAGTYVGVRAASTPADTTQLRLAFPLIARFGDACRTDEDPPERTTAGLQPTVAIRCAGEPGVEWMFVEWPSSSDADLYTRDLSTTRTRVTNATSWNFKGQEAKQGPFYRVADGPATLAAGGYYDRRFTFGIRAPDSETITRVFGSASWQSLDRVPR